MKNIQKIIGFALAVSMLACSFVLSGCNNSDSESSVIGDITYTVTVKDSLGNVYSGVIVKFMQDGEQKAMQPCDESGVASKALPAGNYTAELAFTDNENGFYYEKAAELSAESNSAEIVLSKKTIGEGTALITPAGEFEAFVVSEGCTFIELEADKRNYLLYAPSTAGNYRFSLANNSSSAIGYYGAPHFVQESSATEVKDNSFTISVSASMIGSGEGGTSTYVLGIDANGNENCIICIERIGDPIRTIEDEPWTIYEKTAELSEYTLPENAVIGEFDLTAETDAYSLVLNENDGFYHLNDENGPLVLVRLAEDCDYIACFKTILDRSGVSRYFFDDDGNFVKKVSYSECLLEYIGYVDEAEGVYPLTEDLKHIIQQRGEYVGWWDAESPNYLFKDDNGYNLPDINNEIAWLLMCCYIEQ
ncbi:MAG: hypothetical protein IJO64_05105 [Clostridia bacterium]|nr:hypothetical protein [Clostridia bacterium]